MFCFEILTKYRRNDPFQFSLFFFILFFIADKIVSVSSENDVKAFEIFTRCQNCDRVSSTVQFDRHNCDFIVPRTIIYGDDKVDILWENSVLRKMCTETDSQNKQIVCQYNSDMNVRPKEAKKQLVIQGNHECGVCHRMYVHASGLSRHMETQHNAVEPKEPVHQPISAEQTMADVVKCLICGRIFNSFASCFSHLKTSHAEFGFDDSKYSLQAGDSMLYEKMTVDQVIQCEFCDLLFADAVGLFQHTNHHDINTGYECSSCQLASRNLKFILNHRNSDCPYEMYEKNPIIGCQVRFECGECQAAFDSLADLYEHRFVSVFFRFLCVCLFSINRIKGLYLQCCLHFSLNTDIQSSIFRIC